jgi:DNA/RNA-binding domain of Phe-tRNA-synthetase-like protein
MVRPVAWQGEVMDFHHSSEIWRDFPELVAGVVYADGVTPSVAVGDRVAKFTAVAHSRLAGSAESELPEIRAWRRAFARMGLKPTHYRCASEALLRRLRKGGALPPVHPVVDVCNAISIAFATPVAVFDLAKISGNLEVRYAHGDEDYLTFSGQTEHPSPHEVIFADQAAHVHARRWTNRQSGLSAVQDSTAAVLVVAEAMHQSAQSDVPELVAAIAGELDALWSARPLTAVLTQPAPRFTFRE